MTLEEVLAQIPRLSVDERKQLITAIVDSLFTESTSQQKRSILELEGLGAELWQGIDAQAYVDVLRNEWEERSW